MLLLHRGLANSAQLYFFAVAFWGIWRFIRNQGVDPSYRGALAIAEILIVLQGFTGLVLFLSGYSPARGTIHILYGIMSALILPAVFVYIKGGEDRSEMLIYAAAVLVSAILIMRAILTGSVV